MTTLARRLFLVDNCGLTGYGFILVLLSVVAVVVTISITLIIGLSRHYGRISCRTFAAQTGRPTKFVIYNALNTGDCLTPSGRGKWIPTKNLREFGGTP